MQQLNYYNRKYDLGGIMKNLVYIIVLLICNVSVAHKLKNVSYTTAHTAEQQLELATITLSFDKLPAVQKISEDKIHGFDHDRYFFKEATLSDLSARTLQELMSHKNNYYYLTYQTTSDGIMLDVYYDPRYITYRINESDGINLEQKWVLHVYNTVLLDMYQHDDKPLIQFAYYCHDKYKTSCFLV